MLKGSSFKTRIVVASLGFLIVFFLLFFFFKKKRKHQSAALPKISANFQRKHFQPGTLLFSEFNDLENVKEKYISAEKSFSGIRSCKLSLSTEYGFPIVKKVKEIPESKKIKEIQLEFKCWMRSDVSQPQYIVEIEDEAGKSIVTFSKPIVCRSKFEWNTLHFLFPIDEKYLEPENTIRIYPWNKELREFFIDDISVSYFGENKNPDQAEIAPNYFFDFESPKKEIVQTENIKKGIAHSGVMSVDLSNSEEFGPIITKQFGDVCTSPPKIIGISIWVYPLTDNSIAEIAVSLFNSKNENYFWKGKSVEHKLLPKETWTKISTNIAVPQETITLDDVIQIIPRNKGRTKLLFDDLEIVYDDEAQRLGADSELDSKLINGNSFSHARNAPPFPVTYFQKDEIGNNNSTYINNQKAEQDNFSPNDEFITGNFCADENNLDELINIKSTGSGLYSFYNGSTFTQLWSGAEDINLNSEKIVGDFDSNGTDEVLLIDKKEKKGKMISFTGALSSGNIQLNTNWSVSGNLFENWNTTSSDVFIAGDFNSDKKDELLIVNSSTGDWAVFQYTENKFWKNIAANTAGNKFTKGLFSIKGNPVIGRFSAERNKDVIMVPGNNGDKSAYMQIEFNAGKKQFEQKIISDDSPEISFKNSNATFAGHFDNDTDQEFLNLNTDWRFDLKLIKKDKDGLYVHSGIDFRGYPEDHNPKYYEFVKIVSGNFKTKNNTSVLIMMGNCADKNFNGVHCMQFENFNVLPGSTQLYSIKQ